MSLIPATQGVVKESATFSITSTPTEIPLLGYETYLLLLLGSAPGATRFQMQIEIRYTPTGTWLPVMAQPLAPLGLIPTRTSGVSPVVSGSPPRISSGGQNDTDYSNRAYVIPCFGGAAVRVTNTNGAVTYTGNMVKHVVGPLPFIQAITHEQKYTDWADMSLTTTADAVTGGECLGGTKKIATSFAQMDGRNMQPRITALAYGDYGCGITDIDMIITNPEACSPLANLDPLDLDYPEAIVAWLEFRETPTGNQFPIRAAGSGGNVAVVNDLDIGIPAPANGGGFADIIVVARASFTPLAGNYFWCSFQVEI